MYDRIAVPLDGSAASYAAIGPARRLARVHDAQLVLVSVATGDVAAAEATLAEGRRCAGDDAGTLVIEHPDVASALGAFDTSEPRTLLCMSTLGRGAVGSALLGRTALSVVEHTRHAVVLVGPRCDHGRDTPIDPIIVCLDGTPEAEQVIPWVSTWSERTGASILLLRVMYPMTAPGSGVAPSERFRDDLRYLGDVKRRLQGEHPSITHVTLPSERADAAIWEESSGYEDAMLAVATSHPGTLADLVLGSTAAQVIRDARVPVLVVSKHGTSPPPERDEQASPS